MTVEIYKYQAAGNDFIMIDGRLSRHKTVEYITEDFIRNVCDRHYGIGADGLIVLEDSSRYSFKMVYYNSDGSGGMMCGNGGRAIVAFAADLGYETFDFEAADGFHEAQLLVDGTVRLRMKDVTGVERYDDNSYHLDTGTKHFVRFVKGLSEYPVVEQGRAIRYSAEFAPIGTNVNFVEVQDDLLYVRTYEKGVENETFACGTGIVASSIVAYIYGVKSAVADKETGRVQYRVHAFRDLLKVDFMPVNSGTTGEFMAYDVWLTGPAAKIAKIDYLCRG